MIDLKNKVVLVTGGTRGIGLACGLAFGRSGAATILTHRWGSADEGEIRSRFADAGAPEPMIVEADVGNDADTEALLDAIARRHEGVDVLISNAAVAQRPASLTEYSKRGLFRTIEYSTWPLWAYTDRIRARFGRYPRHIVGMSSDGPDRFFHNYDFIAFSKAMLETMCRYMNAHLFEEGVRVNIVRSRLVRTEALADTFGDDFPRYIEERGFDKYFMEPSEVANVVLALGSGLLDAVGGQVITADRGMTFVDNLNGIYVRDRARKGSRTEE